MLAVKTARLRLAGRWPVLDAWVRLPRHVSASAAAVTKLTLQQASLISCTLKLFPRSSSGKGRYTTMSEIDDPPARSGAPRRRVRYWGWGYEDTNTGEDSALVALDYLGERFGTRLAPKKPLPLAKIDLPGPRLSPPASIAELFSAEPYERVSHAYGKSYRDLVRARRGEFPHPPDLVAMPSDESEIAAILDWCATSHTAAIPYGGGTSVSGGLESEFDPANLGSEHSVSIDLTGLGSLIEVDTISRTARIQAGMRGPAIEEALRPLDLTLRLFPQSFELSTLGGWIATRAAGHFATGPTRIDAFVEALRVITPQGVIDTLEVPSSGAGPDLNALFLGSEGTLGVITEASVRLLARPRFVASGVVDFANLHSGLAAVRGIAQSGLVPASCRLLDEAEAVLAGIGNGSEPVLLLGFESADHPVGACFERAGELCCDSGGVLRDPSAQRGSQGRSATTAMWRRAFLDAPYLRDHLIAAGVICETVETAATWKNLDALIAGVRSAAAKAFVDAGATGGFITCRITHAYPDGAAPYFTVLAPARSGSELSQWSCIKEGLSDAITSAHATITHHHGVGRFHRPWYEREAPALARSALLAAKQSLDPAGIMNPGALFA